MDNKMSKITLTSLEEFLTQIFTKLGLSEENVNYVKDVFIQSTIRNAGQHDIYDLPQRLNLLKQGRINPNTQLPLLKSFGAIEQRDGENALGEIVCARATQRSIELAKQYGIGVCVCKNSNHFLCGAVYSQSAAKKGYISMILAKGGMTMGVMQSQKPCMSALPMSCAYPTQNGEVVMDFCLSYASLGQLVQKDKKGEKVKEWWGVDENHNLCDDPAKIAFGGMRLAIGDYKGFSLAMIGELLTGVLGEGTVMDQVKEKGENKSSTLHTVITIKADAFCNIEEFVKSSTLIGDRAKQLSGVDLRLPGEHSQKEAETIVSQGYIMLEDELIDKLNVFAKEYDVQLL